MSWSRRIGLAAALVLLIGGSIGLAGEALDPGRGQPDAPAASVPPPPPPALIGPAASLTSSATADLTLIAPSGLRRDQEYQIRVFVNGELAQERRLPDRRELVLASVPLSEGSNEIRAALIGAGGMSEPSAPVTITSDTERPVIRITQPEPGTVYASAVTLRGRTEAGADLSIVDQRADRPLEVTVEPDGRFTAEVQLVLGSNPLLVRSADPAGNLARTRLVIVRDESNARLRLDISAPEELATTELPFQLEMVATVKDELGQPIEGAEVTFSLSPPNAATRTFRTSTVAGLASWPDVELVADDATVGTWLVTVLAVLPSGAELREDRSFSVLLPV